MESKQAISTYHEFILEAIASLRLGLQFLSASKEREYDGSDSYRIYSEMSSRYTFLMISNSLEAAANALLLSLELDSEYYSELEKLNTLLKFRLFCEFQEKRLDIGNVVYSRVRDIIACRNEFVHPKPKMAVVNFKNETGDLEYQTKSTKNRNYPLYLSKINHNHALTALEDVLKFLSWVCFDTCMMDVKEGAYKLGIHSYGSTADLEIIEGELDIKFDRRTFGVN